jgi:signal transduction histidine kinase
VRRLEDKKKYNKKRNFVTSHLSFSWRKWGSFAQKIQALPDLHVQSDAIMNISMKNKKHRKVSGSSPLPVRGALRQSFVMPLVVFLLAVLSISTLIWTHLISEAEISDIALTEAVVDLQRKTALSHLWLEEAIAGDDTVDIRVAIEDLDSAVALAGAILDGGETEHALALHPLRDSKYRKRLEEIRALLTRTKAIALQRIQDPKGAGIGSVQDQAFDAVFKEFERQAGALEMDVSKRRVLAQARSKRLSLAIILAWASIAIVATIGVWSREVKRKAAETALRKANEDLRARTDELRNHQDHLTELVQERTVEITDAYRHLQQEIIERKVMESNLRESKEKFEKLSSEFRTLLEAITDPLTLLSPDLKVIWANHSMACGMGREISDLGRSYCYTRWHEAAGPCDNCPAVKTFQTGKEEVTQVEAPDGKLWEMRSYPIKGEDGDVRNVLTVAMDITEKMNLQAEATRAAHLASLGELAAGVAHEINNPINGIINYAQILADERGRSDGMDDIPDRIIKEGNRIATIVRSLLSFARQRKEEKCPVGIHQIMADTLALSGAQMRKDGIVLKTEIPAELPGIIAHAQQIEQVFLNLLNNARYALNQKYPEPNADKILEIRGDESILNGRPYLRITFHDRGTGIPARILPKVIDPFFSTKPKAMGTGLGLSISHGIVSDHGGELSIQSVEGEFTKVVISLPACMEIKNSVSD